MPQNRYKIADHRIVIGIDELASHVAQRLQVSNTILRIGEWMIRDLLSGGKAHDSRHNSVMTSRHRPASRKINSTTVRNRCHSWQRAEGERTPRARSHSLW